MKPKVIDLFAGVGGLSLGFKMAGFEIVLANEFEESIAKSYIYNHPDTEVIVEDITKLSIKDVFSDYKDRIDVVIGGPPCQGFSQKGQRKSINDDRNYLFKQFVEVVILLYGVPGSGKSYKIEKEYCNDFNFMERVVFHPDYMNTDFVGQILPTVKGEGEDKEITYDFTPGPFTRVLKKAIENPGDHYYLVIEEINRGNAPAIFGEIFQLLDRDDVGKSSYEITNYNIANEVFNKKEKPIYLPSNLHILATMNTADQNVFTLDTAFQRRWDMKMIENDVSKAEHASKSILNTNVTWERFNTVINDQIITSSAATLSSEDKRLGAYFVTEEVLKFYSKEENLDDVIQKYSINDRDADKIDKAIKDLNSRFGDKVIKYLWDDAFKFSRDELFDVEYKSLEKVLDTFNYSVSDERFNVFNQDIKENLFRTLDTEDSEDE